MPILNPKIIKPLIFCIIAAVIFFTGRASVKIPVAEKATVADTKSDVDLTKKSEGSIMLPAGTELPSGIKLPAPALLNFSDWSHLIDKSVSHTETKESTPVIMPRPFLYGGISYSRYVGDSEREQDAFGITLAGRIDENILSAGYVPTLQRVEFSILFPLPIKIF